jgi:CRISPR-associated protein Csm2
MSNYNNPRHSGGGQRKQGAQRQPKVLPTPRPVTYYSGGRLEPSLMDDKAEKTAQMLRQVKTTQLRRFYEDVLNLRQRLAIETQRKGDVAAFEQLRADFKMLKAKAVYANGRSQKIFPEEFLQFIIDHVQSVNNAQDFEAFYKHFQAVVAFHKFYGTD